MAIANVGVLAVERTLARGEPSEEAMAVAQEAFAAEAREPLVLNALRGERALAFRLFAALESGEVPLSALSDGGVSRSSSGFGTAGHLMYRYNQGIALQLLTKAVEIAKKPDHEQPPLWRQWNQESDPKSKSRIEMLSGALAYLLMPAVESVGAAGARSHATTGMGAALLAAERFRKLKSHWPESIEQIEKALNVQLPPDPYTGAPFRLRRTEDGLTIYSVGPDLVDNAGEINNRAGPNVSNVDYGFRLWDVAKRRQEPALREAAQPDMPQKKVDSP